MNIQQIERTAATSYAKGREYFDQLFKSGKLPKCSGGYISGACSHNSGHRYAAPYLCGKEFCEDCGRDGSPIHTRRVSRWLNLVKNWPRLGYIVLTFPEEIREFFKNKEVLNDYRYQLRRKLKRDGYGQGLARWHFFGDCNSCNGAGCNDCNNTGAGRLFHPHLNVFIADGYKQPSELKAFIEDLQQWSRRYYIRLLNSEIEKREQILKTLTISNVSILYNEIELLNGIIQEQKNKYPVINYSYTNSKKKIINRLKYVLRSTFRIYNQDIKEHLHNFRNCVRWGFSRQKAEKGLIYCPQCEKQGHQHPIKWTNREQYNKQIKYQNYENGIYTLSDRNSGNYQTAEPPPATAGRRIAKLFTWSKNKPTRQKHSNIGAG
jgi:hypothetical protein